MKRSLMFIFSMIGILVLSIGFVTELENAEILVKKQPYIGNGDQIRVVTVAEQEMRENSIEEGDRYTVITAEEQSMVENSSNLSGFVPQENGAGFYFSKEK
jgi:hypothetical protein